MQINAHFIVQHASYIYKKKKIIHIDVQNFDFSILLSGNVSKVTYFEVGQIFKEKQSKIIYFPIYNNNSHSKNMC